MLRVTTEEHRLNFRIIKNSSDALVSASQDNDKIKESIILLLSFYAVEVGFKYLLSYQEKIPFRHEKASKKDEDVEGFGHDLAEIIARLKISPSKLSAPPSGPFNCALNAQDFRLDQAHEAWRYGLKIVNEDQVILKNYLEEVEKYLLFEVPE